MCLVSAHPLFFVPIAIEIGLKRVVPAYGLYTGKYLVHRNFFIKQLFYIRMT